MTQVDQQRIENLGPAERVIQTLLQHVDHAFHNRPGAVVAPRVLTASARRVAPAAPELPVWTSAEWRVEGEPAQKLVYLKTKVGNQSSRRLLGVMLDDMSVISPDGEVVGQYRDSGLFPEVVAHLYCQIADVWSLDNEFAARWASYAYGEDNRDLKCILAAFMLVQSRKGDPVLDGGEVVMRDADFRDVGEAMCLVPPSQKRAKGNVDLTLNAKMLGRVGDILKLPGVVAINRQLGFGRSLKNEPLGRWPKVVQKWLRFRENNPKMLEGLVAAGFRDAVMDLARRVGYKPASPAFFEILRWSQEQAPDGRRQIAVGQDMGRGQTWEELTETQICQRIVDERPSFKVLTGKLPRRVGLTRAVMAAAIEVGSVKEKDLVILTPTLEELGLLDVQDVRERWERATRAATDTRAANVAQNVRSQQTKDQLQASADAALQKAVAEEAPDLDVFVMVDVSGSQREAIVRAKAILPKFLQAFALDRLHVVTFNTTGREINIQLRSAVGVEQAFRGVDAGGGTAHGAGVRKFAGKVSSRESILLVIGDEGEAKTFTAELREVGLAPLMIGLIKLPGDPGRAVQATAAELGVPCVPIDDKIFDDVYAVPRLLKHLAASTPVGEVAGAAPRARRETLVERILKTPLLVKPVWA